MFFGWHQMHGHPDSRASVEVPQTLFNWVWDIRLSFDLDQEVGGVGNRQRVKLDRLQYFREQNGSGSRASGYALGACEVAWTAQWQPPISGPGEKDLL
jgi:hypothetical protein